ncbi:Lrp/AsnC family transcriptional regulator [Thioclava sp. BHET1]|uniref:AsnC family transcriptional regulator n=1 Tax=Thioclava dalianensis TaxID=1185766 RepID=A0A074T953_9RHOB|nr:Lrp/AsnC family transcriptional regulator [Thioclava dalianensis]KEP68301.1 AsnC family transcriptional regulator [Thioclava dalianensis]TMV88045.1 Lrp/AsnC family transcriptional regulator [Thioclava sp. BHET1]SFN80667.1 Lrp/AsnC family transcriptional regulator, leucine-responsive regulatory protein [Thioclava dalianensis]
MDLVDIDLLRRLEENARLSFAELAEQMQMTKTPVWKRVKALESSGAIQGYRTRLDPKVLGFELEAMIEVTLSFDAAEAFERAVLRHPAILRCHATTGEYDYLLHVLARDMTEMDDLIRYDVARFPGVTRTRSSVVTRAIKREQSLAELMRARR